MLNMLWVHNKNNKCLAIHERGSTFGFPGFSISVFALYCYFFCFISKWGLRMKAANMFNGSYFAKN